MYMCVDACHPKKSTGTSTKLNTPHNKNNANQQVSLVLLAMVAAAGLLGRKARKKRLRDCWACEREKHRG